MKINRVLTLKKIGVATPNKKCVASSSQFGAHFLLDW